MSWIIKEQQIKDFYSKIKFPGPYNIQDFDVYDQGYTNNFVEQYNNAIMNSKNILDVGCGTGFLTNYFAYKYPDKKFEGIDFSDSIDFAENFSIEHKLKNVTYTKTNFLDVKSDVRYDCIISNGVIHHIPLYEKAIQNIKNILTEDGVLVLGVYNKFGKLAKKFFSITYASELLRVDQEEVPFEISFTNKDFLGYFTEFDVEQIYPSVKNKFTDIKNLFNYKNGGLTIYRLSRKIS